MSRVCIPPASGAHCVLARGNPLPQGSALHRRYSIAHTACWPQLQACSAVRMALSAQHPLRKVCEPCIAGCWSVYLLIGNCTTIVGLEPVRNRPPVLRTLNPNPRTSHPLPPSPSPLPFSPSPAVALPWPTRCGTAPISSPLVRALRSTLTRSQAQALAGTTSPGRLPCASPGWTGQLPPPLGTA